MNDSGDESDGGAGWASLARQGRMPACHSIVSTPYRSMWAMGSSDDDVKEESVREERGGGGEGVFSWCVITLICSSSYVKHTSSQLE